MMSLKILLTILAIVVLSTQAADYCNISSCGKNQHTMCLYPNPNAAAACGQGSKSGLSNAEENDIVNKHNELRRLVASGKETRGNPGPQPAAVNMPDLKWDNELATIAQRWANQCNFQHDKCRNVEKFLVGQNLAMELRTANSAPDLKVVVQQWYDEVDYFSNGSVSEYSFDYQTGHYTQLVWAETTLIGCGLSTYKQGGWYNNLVVCNYGPAGNFIGESVYEVN